MRRRRTRILKAFISCLKSSLDMVSVFPFLFLALKKIAVFSTRVEGLISPAYLCWENQNAYTRLCK